MHGAVGTNLGPMQRNSQRPGRRMVAFSSPFLFPTGLKLKSVEEKSFQSVELMRLQVLGRLIWLYSITKYI